MEASPTSPTDLLKIFSTFYDSSSSDSDDISSPTFTQPQVSEPPIANLSKSKASSSTMSDSHARKSLKETLSTGNTVKCRWCPISFAMNHFCTGPDHRVFCLRCKVKPLQSNDDARSVNEGRIQHLCYVCEVWMSDIDQHFKFFHKRYWKNPVKSSTSMSKADQPDVTKSICQRKSGNPEERKGLKFPSSGNEKAASGGQNNRDENVESANKQKHPHPLQEAGKKSTARSSVPPGDTCSVASSVDSKALLVKGAFNDGQKIQSSPSSGLQMPDQDDFREPLVILIEDHEFPEAQLTPEEAQIVADNSLDFELPTNFVYHQSSIKQLDLELVQDTPPVVYKAILCAIPPGSKYIDLVPFYFAVADHLPPFVLNYFMKRMETPAPNTIIQKVYKVFKLINLWRILANGENPYYYFKPGVLKFKPHDLREMPRIIDTHYMLP